MLLIGLIVGLPTNLIVPGKDGEGIIVTALLGIGGSLLAGLLGRAAGFYAEGAGAGFIISVLGAILLLGYTGRSSGLSRTGSPFA